VTRRTALVAVGACLLTALAGCPLTDEHARPDRSDAPVSSPPGPALPTRATTDLPAYAGPPPDGPVTAGPVTAVRAAVDLTPATPGVFAVAESAVATPDGRTLVLLAPVDHRPMRIATVAGGQVSGSVEVPRVAEAAGMHLTVDGAAVVVGQFSTGDGARGDIGFAVVDPSGGAARTGVVAPLDDGTFPFVRSALSADGRTLFVFVTVVGTRAFLEQLVAVDVGTGRVRARRNIAPDVATASLRPVGFEAAGLVARPGGGVTLEFDASPTPRVERIPTLLRYDAELFPQGEPVRLTDLAEAAETQAVDAAADGTVFVVAEVRDESWLLAVPDGGGAGPVLAVLDDPAHDYALAVDAAQAWALLPSAGGVRAVDLRSGEVRGAVDLGCRTSLRLRVVARAGDGDLLVGDCGTPSVRTATLWLVGP
jgi:hypothetical protein